jgi:predicted transcriptional regulator
MNTKRDRITIINELLEFVRDKAGKARPTRIMYKVNLSHEMLGEYLRELLSKGLITETLEEGKKNYSLTDKGYSFLKDYKQMKGFIDSYGLN